MGSGLSSRAEWLAEATWSDYVIPALVVGGNAALAVEFQHADVLGWSSLSQRLAVYGTGATVISIVGGLSTVAVSVYLAAGGERARTVRLLHRDALRRNWLALVLGTGLAAALCLVAQAIDGAGGPHYARFVFEFAMVFAAMRFLRLAWLMNAMIRVSDADLTDQPLPPAPELQGTWSGSGRGAA